MEKLFNKRLVVAVRCQDCEERKANIRVTVELQLTTSPVHRRDLLVRLTDDADPFFLFSLSISEEDFQSLKVQQGLLIDFTSFPQKFIELLNLCISEQDSDNPRFLLQLTYQSPVLDDSATFSIVETNAFKHLIHLSLRLLHGSDAEIKDYLAVCLFAFKEEKQSLELKLKKTEEDLSRQLTYAQQTVSEKTRELDKLRSEWTSQSSSLSTRHTQDLTVEREKALETQSRLQQQKEQLRQELESSSQQLQSRLTELDASRYKNQATIRDLKIKLVGAEEESQRATQQVSSLRRENGRLDAECHEKERLLSQLQTRVAVGEQEVKDQDRLMLRTNEVLRATQQQKESMEGTAESKEVHIRKLEATVKSLSEDVIKVKADKTKADSIIKKLLAELQRLSEKNQMKNTVIVTQDKSLQEKVLLLQGVQEDLRDAHKQLLDRDEQVSKLNQKLNESRELLKTNENVISWLNKQLNENQLSRKVLPPETFATPSVVSAAPGLRVGNVSHSVAQFLPMSGRPVMSPVEAAASIVQHPAVNHKQTNKHNGEPAGLDSKYFERSDDSIPLHGLLPALHHREFRSQLPAPSAYFSRTADAAVED